MGEFVLNKGYELKLPSNFEDVDRKEIEHIDGGSYTTDMAALVAALAACGGVMVSYGGLSYNKKRTIESKFGVAIAVSGAVITVTLMANRSRKVIGNMWGGVKKYIGF